jgi:hypothetical protein
MQNKTDFFELNEQDKNIVDLPNVSIYSIMSFRKNSNSYNTDVFIKKFGWVTLKISFDKFNQLVTLHK